MVDRRSFLRRVFGAVAAGAVLDVDQLLWVPGAKTIWLPPAAPVELNTLITPDWVTREALALFQHQLTFVAHVTRHYDEQFARTVRIRRPAAR